MYTFDDIINLIYEHLAKDKIGESLPCDIRVPITVAYDNVSFEVHLLSNGAAVLYKHPLLQLNRPPELLKWALVDDSENQKIVTKQMIIHMRTIKMGWFGQKVDKHMPAKSVATKIVRDGFYSSSDSWDTSHWVGNTFVDEYTHYPAHTELITEYYTPKHTIKHNLNDFLIDVIHHQKEIDDFINVP